MSVYKRKQNKSKIDFYYNVNKLSDAIQDMVENPSWYPKRQTFKRAIPLLDISRRLAEAVCIANENFPTSEWDYVERRRNQILAVGLAEALLQQFQRDCRHLHIPSGQKRLITALAVEVIDQLKAWKENDKSRFGNLT